MKLFSNLTVRLIFHPLHFIIFLWYRLPLELDLSYMFGTPWCLSTGIQDQWSFTDPFCSHLPPSILQTTWRSLPVVYVGCILFFVNSPSLYPLPRLLLLFLLTRIPVMCIFWLAEILCGYEINYFNLRMPILQNTYIIIGRALSSNSMVILYPRANNAITKTCLETLQIWSYVWSLNSVYDMFYI